MRLLKLDPRPYEYDSTVEVSGDPAAIEVLPDVEMSAWAPITPERPSALPRLAFVDGVQRVEMRLSAEGDGVPIPGAIVSCAAGAVLPAAQPPVQQVLLDRRVVLARGASSAGLRLQASNGEVVFQPMHSAGDDFESITRTLNDLRALLEAGVVRALLQEKLDLIIVDGRLPEVRQGPVVGLIKTLHSLYVTEPEQLGTLTALQTGQRSPVFAIQRARTAYYSWFVCLRAPGRFELGLSGLVRLEMDDSLSREDAFRFADATAALLPPFASTPNRDPRAPQNLLPIGQLERELRHGLGDPELLRRLLFKTFREEIPEWSL